LWKSETLPTIIPEEPKKLIDFGAKSYLNFTAFGPNELISGGKTGKWSINEELTEDEPQKVSSFWDIQEKQFKLGDFKSLVNFLIEKGGKKVTIEKEIPV
jgi:hypothetical protein